MIITRLMGGLGNQMFQYAAGKSLAEAHQTTLKLDLSYLLDRSPRKDFTFRNYALTIFNIREEFATSQEVQRFHSWSNQLLVKFALSNLHYVKERFFHFDSNILNLTSEVYLEGYWQSAKYFSSITSILQKEFTIKSTFPQKNQELEKKIRNTNAICVNVRRGDFVANLKTNQFHGVCETDYFNQGMEILAQKVNDSHIFIFSDDIEWCIHNLNFAYPTTYITKEMAGINDGYHMYLMSLCKHYIIANSSFAWWSVWLNTNLHKIVVAPKKWFNDTSINTNDLIPKDWYRI